MPSISSPLPIFLRHSNDDEEVPFPGSLTFRSMATTPRDLLPPWLVHHDHRALGSSNQRHRSESSSQCDNDHGNSRSTAFAVVPSPLKPPGHISMIPWDDGFTPSGCNDKPGKIIHNQARSTPNAFQVVDHAVTHETADLLYESAVRATVWGVYVPTSELLSVQNNSDEEIDGDEEQHRKSLAKRAVRELLVEKAASVISSEDWKHTHGVAVWVIASDCDDETEYHLDYAEMVRYETNVIVPPIYGATLHVSPLRSAGAGGAATVEDDIAGKDTTLLFDGGGFHVNLNGLEHYKQYGYKTRLKNKLTTDELEAISSKEHGWQHVPYLYRRGIICDGEFPHFSGRVRSLPEVAARDSTLLPPGLPLKRVVVGFNLFPHEIGAFVHKFPEHSNAFNKYIKVSQAAVKKTGSGSPQWSLESIRANPKQAAFLKFLAKKMKEKNIDLATLRQSTGNPAPAKNTAAPSATASAKTEHIVAASASAASTSVS